MRPSEACFCLEYTHGISLFPDPLSSQSAQVQQVVNTIKQFGDHPATVFKLFVVIGIIAGVTILALAIWRHKEALDISAPLCAAKVLHKATQQDAYIEYARMRYPQPTTIAAMPAPPPTFSAINENTGAMRLFPANYPSNLHNSHLVSPIPTYPHEPLPIHNDNHGMVG